MGGGGHILRKIMFCVTKFFFSIFSIFFPSGQSSKRRTLDRAESDSNNTESLVTFTD